MSGEAGGFVESEYYRLSIFSGVMVTVDPPPNVDPDAYVASYYEQSNKAYLFWAKQVEPKLTLLIERYRDERLLSLSPLSEANEHCLKVIDIASLNGPARAEVQIAANPPVASSTLESLTKELKAILVASAMGA